MKANYRLWESKLEDFLALKSPHEQLAFFIRLGALAPSSHNSQPWKFKIGENSIKIYPDFSRRLPESDKNDRQLYISLGCALENILLAADYFGYITQTEFFSQNDPECAANITLRKQKNAESNPQHPAAFITKRSSNRTKYLVANVREDLQRTIQSFSMPDLQINIITDATKRRKIANIVIDAGITAMDNVGFRTELSRYVKSNYTSSPLGMPLFGFGMPGPFSILGPAILKRFNMNRLSKKQDLDLLINHTPAFIVISTKEDSKKEWILTGKTYERIALEALRSGYNTATLAAPIQIGEYFKNLQAALQTSFRPQYFGRLGVAQSLMKHSPRLSVENVLTA